MRKQKEYDRIVSKGEVQDVSQYDLPNNLKIMGNRFFLSMKDPETAEERYRARWMLQRHGNK